MIYGDQNKSPKGEFTAIIFNAFYLINTFLTANNVYVSCVDSKERKKPNQACEISQS